MRPVTSLNLFKLQSIQLLFRANLHIEHCTCTIFQLTFFYNDFSRSIIVYLQSIVLILIVLLWNPVRGSLGDKCYPFRQCLRECERGCHLDEYPGKLPLYLTIFWWDCTDECKYQCMHNVTATDVRFNKQIKQFYGKVRSDFKGDVQSDTCDVQVCT